MHWIVPHALADESRWYVLKVGDAVRQARCRLAQRPFVWEVGAGKLPLRPVSKNRAGQMAGAS